MELKMIMEIAFFTLALLGFLAALGLALYLFIKKKCMGALKPIHLLFAGVVIAGILLYTVAYFYEANAGAVSRWFKAPFQAIYSTVRLFMCDGDYSVVLDGDMDDIIKPYYVVLMSVLQVMAPALTAGAILSVFYDLFSRLQYRFSRNKDICVFSELNEGSLILAKDLKENHSKSAIVFAGIDSEKTSDELQRRAQELDAILFRKEVTELPLDKHCKDKSIWFFAIAQDEQTNVKHGLHLAEQYGDRERTNLYVFADSLESEALFSTLHNKKILVRRISLVRSVTNRMLYDQGMKLFETANPQPDGKKIITAVVVGMKKYGTVMAKTLPWFTQMDGYHLHLHLFDARRDAVDKFAMDCPELLMKNYNGVPTKEGESCDTIDFYSGVLPDTKTFADRIAGLKAATYVLVDLGRDDRNIETAMTLRMLFERIGAKPEIQVVLSSSEKKRALADLHYRNKPLNLTFIGDPESCYTENVILNTDIEANAMRVHMQYCQSKDGKVPPTEEDKAQHSAQFWEQEYNYRSSVAAAMAGKIRMELGISGADKLDEERTEEEKAVIGPLEHRRWNAYMRSEGYVYDKIRNNLARTHYDLVHYDDLPEDERIKDGLVSGN